MKRIIALLLTVTLALSCTVALTGCLEIPAPEGYTLYKAKGISFAYPEDWSLMKYKDYHIIRKYGQFTDGSNIIVESRLRTGLYKNMNMKKFDTLLAPILQEEGISYSNVNISFKSTSDVVVTVITYDAYANKVSMNQTLLIFSSGLRTYMITVTQRSNSTVIVNTILKTLTK